MAFPIPAPETAAPNRGKKRAKERYELQEQIGSGGMGTVYRALDRELNRTVAVKVLRNELVPDLRNLLRLKREIVLACRVTDEHVVRVHDFGEIEGRALISMDWVDGESLARILLRMHRLPPSQVRGLAIQICQALRAIHAAKIVHQDLKPGNLLVRRDGAILVSDFGLARSALPQDFKISGAGEVGGTRAYMAPEQLAGLPADSRSDLYAFGMVLLEMLTDTLALEALAPLRLGWLAAEGDKYRRAAELRDLGVLDGVIRGCLQPDRTLRYGSADAILADLQIDVKPIERSPSVLLRIRRALNSRAWRLALAAVTLFLGLLGYAALRRQAAFRAAQTSQLYAKATGQLTDEGGETELRTALESLDQLTKFAPGDIRAFRLRVDTLIRLYEHTHDPQWLQEAGEALESRAGSGLPSAERRVFRARIELDAGRFADVIRTLQSDSALMSSSEAASRLVGRAFASSQQPGMAIQFFDAAIRLDPDSWRAHNDKGSALLSLGRLDSARKEFTRVTELRPASPIGYENLGSTMLAAGDFAGARHYFEIALEHAPLSSAYFNLGVAAFFSREYAAAIPFFEAAIRIRPNSDVYVAGLADALRRLHRTERSRESYARALGLLNELAKTRSLSVTEQSRRAVYLARLGDGAAAIAALDEIPRDIKSRDVSFAGAVLAMLEGRPRAANRCLKDAVRSGYPYMLIEMNPDFDDIPP